MTVSRIVPRRRPGRSASGSLDVRVDIAAVLSLLAAAIHVIVIGPHFQEWWAYGAFFLATAVGQAVFAVLVLLWTPVWLLLWGIIGNLAIVGMYVISRTSGPPLGPGVGRAEDAGL